MCLNKPARVQPAARVLTIPWPDERRNELAHFEMKVRPVAALRGADSGDLLAAPDFFASCHQHGLKVSVI
jgi:hypothetical protein